MMGRPETDYVMRLIQNQHKVEVTKFKGMTDTEAYNKAWSSADAFLERNEFVMSLEDIAENVAINLVAVGYKREGDKDESKPSDELMTQKQIEEMVKKGKEQENKPVKKQKSKAKKKARKKIAKKTKKNNRKK